MLSSNIHGLALPGTPQAMDVWLKSDFSNSESGAAQSCKNCVSKTSNFDNIFIRYIQVAQSWNLEGFFAFDLCKTGWANAHPAHPEPRPLQFAAELLAAFANAERLGNSRLEWRQIFSPKVLLHRTETTEPLFWKALFENYFFWLQYSKPYLEYD